MVSPDPLWCPLIRMHRLSKGGRCAAVHRRLTGRLTRERASRTVSRHFGPYPGQCWAFRRCNAGASVARLRQQGLDISYIHRDHRSGYKAGALQEGLKIARGELVAVFDADFVPGPDFLLRSVQFFTDERVGMVQVRWEHLNREYSHLTQAQAIFLDGHFVIEHTARNRSGRSFNFNGTAGGWRRETIEDAGGWQHDTLTEDLDLSYRAQLEGWRFVYLAEVVSPAEVPVEMNAFKTQQHRWAKGSIQTARKLLPRILKSDLP